MNPLIGKKVTAVYLAEDNMAIRLDVDGGPPIVARTYGDCCSETWIESLDNVDALIGGTVQSVENIELPEQEAKTEDYDVIQFYGCRIVTDRGHCTIDYRNRSNGYYGGDLSWPDDYFYRGVFDQNVSTEKWRSLGGGTEPVPC